MRQIGLVLALSLAGCTKTEPQAAREPSSLSPASSTATKEKVPAANAPSRVRLIVWLTIDQLRGDSFSRFAHLVTSEGLGRLLERGTHFTDATYDHAITETAPGHATLFTGASPREHGIVANEWMSADGSVVPSVFDVRSPLIGPDLDPSEVDGLGGRSSAPLLLPTVGDAFRERTHGGTRVVSVSLKDRSAILPAGQGGQAFWLGKRSFVTSRRYASAVPPLLVTLAREHPLASYQSGGWPLLLPEGAYRARPERPALGSRVDARAEVFPHSPRPGSSAAAWLRSTPMGDEAVIDLAKAAYQSFDLGTDEVVDLLAISLSSNDYVGHLYGPESREAEDTFARLDRLLAGFFGFIDGRNDASEVLFVLSADHGISETPESRLASGLPGMRVSKKDVETASRAALERAYGHARYLRGVAWPGVYLDQVSIAKSGQTLAAVAERLALDLSALPGIHRVFTRASLLSDSSELARRVAESMLEGRSGDLYVVLAPEAQLADGDFAASHGSPWYEDRHVPIVLAGPGVPPGKVGSAVDVRALAGTVADLVGLPPPAGAHPARLLSASRGRAASD